MKAMKFSLACLFSLFSMVSCLDGDTFDSAAQFTKDVQAIDNYLATNGINAYKDPSGIRFTISSLGTLGLPPKRSHTVKVDYTGRLLSTGEVFDSGTTELPLTNYIAGWIEGLEVFPVGTIGKLYIPSGLAYGNQAKSGIPANSILVFDVELRKVTRSNTEITRLETDINTIDAYLEDEEIANVIVDEFSGIRYTVEEEGEGYVPTWYDQVRIDYTARVLNATSDFFSGVSEPDNGVGSRVVDYLQGLQAGFLKLPEGSKATLYIPSPLGFGAVAVGSNGEVPANSILVIKIKSLEIVN